jgi:hypothetical protein
VTLRDIEGRFVSDLFDGSVASNATSEVTVDGAGLAAGVYIARIAGENFTEARRIVLSR